MYRSVGSIDEGAFGSTKLTTLNFPGYDKLLTIVLVDRVNPVSVVIVFRCTIRYQHLKVGRDHRVECFRVYQFFAHPDLQRVIIHM